MASEFKLPELGENVHGGDVLRVLVKTGDIVKNDQPVLELETDKATIEVPSSVDGTVKEVRVKPGQKVKVGEVVLVLDDKAEGAGEAAASATAGSNRPKTQPAGAPEEGGLSQQM